jgi:uridine kinase
MEIQDLVKLAYQASQGGGHLVASEADALAFLRAESEQTRTEQHEPEPDVCEPAGPDFCRVHLRALPAAGLSLDTVARVFILSAAQPPGGQQALDDLLGQVRAALEQDLPLARPIGLADWDRWIAAYRAQGCPAVHHSDAYRLSYRPAYRLVTARFARILPLFQAIDPLLRDKPRVVVALDGCSGSGKSTWANFLHEVYGGNLFHMDDFFLRPGQRTEKRLAETGGNIDYERFAADVLAGLAGDAPFGYRRYDCRTQTLGEPILVKPARFNLIEGVYSHHPIFAGHYDLKAFLRVTADQQHKRILARSGPELYRRFVNEWIPMENRYFSTMQIAENSDLILDV